MTLKPNISAVLFPWRMVRHADPTLGRRQRDCQRSKCPGSVSHCPTPAEATDLAQTTVGQDAFNAVLPSFVQA
jgi:hypothetical protein